MSDIIARCKKALEEHYGARFAGMVLYGSMARGEARSTSDIDLLVLLKEPFDYFQELRTITELLYPLQLGSDCLISAKPAAVEEYERGSLQLPILNYCLHNLRPGGHTADSDCLSLCAARITRSDFTRS